MLKAWGQEDTALSPEEASCWESRASGHLVSSAGWASWPSGLFPRLPSALRGREWALQAVLSRVLGHRAAGQVSPRRACGKKLESGWGWEEARNFCPSSALGAISASSCVCLVTPAPCAVTQFSSHDFGAWPWRALLLLCPFGFR